MISVLAFAAVPAGALVTRSLEGGFGPDGTSASEFLDPWSLAADQSASQLYVASLDGVVWRFGGATHTLEALPNVSFGLSPISEEGSQLAVNSTTHDFYVVGPTLRAFQPNAEPAKFSAGPGKGTNEIGSEVCGVAVDANGDIYVSEFAGGIHVYAPSGESLREWPSFGKCNLAVDSLGNVYLATPRGPVEKLVPSEFPVTSSTTYSSVVVDEGEAFTVAVDPSDDHLLISEGSQIAEYSEGGMTRIGVFGAGEGLASSEGLAVSGTSDETYVSNTRGSRRQVEIFSAPFVLPDVTTGQASEVEPQGTATLNGTVDPDGVKVTNCHFDYGQTSAYGQTKGCEQTVGGGNGEVGVTAKLTGLEPGVTYHFHLQASNEQAEAKGAVNAGDDMTFTMPPRPMIDALSSANLSASSVDLNARINPGGQRTNCRLEYGPSTTYGTVVPCKPETLEGASDVAVSEHVEGLSPDVTYHWRLVARNEAGTTMSVDNTFLYDTAGEGLPDNRAYEMVTPAHKNAALIGSFVLGVERGVAEGGSQMVATSVQCFAGAESCAGSRRTQGEPYLFTRTADGWAPSPLAPPATRFEVNSAWLADAETGMALFSMPTPPMSEDDFYAREPGGSFADIGPATPPSRGALGTIWSVHIRATSDFSRIVFQEPHAWPFDESLGTSTYEFVGTGNSAPVLVGVSGGAGSTDLISKCETLLSPTEIGLNPGEVSADGETVYFTASACGAGGTGTNAGVPVPVAEVFARVGAARTVAISEPSAFSAAAPYPGCSKEPCIKDVNDKESWRGAEFAGASDDGTKAFFTSDQQLTDDASPEGNLYEYHAQDCGGEGHLIDVSAGDTSGRGPQVQGVVAISADGSHVYFVAQGVLTTAANSEGATAQGGVSNLYVFEHEECRPGGHIAFIAQLTGADSGQWVENERENRANVTPDGRFLVFESSGALTADDTRIDGAQQIFRYDAQTRQLIRISVGDRGFNDDGNTGSGNAAIVPAYKGATEAGPARSDPTMSHNGSYVFFMSPIGLTPDALNDVQVGGQLKYAENVYEWHEGEVHLISDGRDTGFVGNDDHSAVELVGSDASGANVFFTTTDSLVPSDTDTQLDYYDARICTRESPCISSPPPTSSCVGEVCHGTPTGTPPVQVGPSATFNGQGNIGGAATTKKRGKPQRCVKSKRRVRGKCVKIKAKGGKHRKVVSRKGGK